jgi:hypothetical protein
VTLDAAEDGIGVTMGRAQGETHQVQFGGRCGADDRAVVGVVAGLEHLSGVDRDRDLAALRRSRNVWSLAPGASKTSTGWTSSGR